MKITINKTETILPDCVKTVGDMLDNREIKRQGTAVALNNKLITACSWDNTPIAEGDSITLISAAFGG